MDMLFLDKKNTFSFGQLVLFEKFENLTSLTASLTLQKINWHG